MLTFKKNDNILKKYDPNGHEPFPVMSIIMIKKRHVTR